MKTIIQRNLPITQAYKMISSRYESILDGFGVCCDNCGRPISNIATVEGQTDGRQYQIGMDCAETLTGIKGDWDFQYLHKANFSRAKSIRAWVVKQQKAGNTVTIKAYEKGYHIGGGFLVNAEQSDGGSLWKNESKDLAPILLPMLKDLIDTTSINL